MKPIKLLIALLLAAGLSPLRAQTDTTVFSLLDLARPGLERVAALHAAGDDTAAAEALRETILTRGKPEGFAPLLTMLEASPSPLPDNPYVRYAADRIPALFAALRQRDAEAAGEAAYSIAGCGIGLTPSADDFLCGVMASVLASAIARGEQNEWLPITAAMAKRAAPRTNLISAAFLRQAACGQLSSDVLTLIRTLYSSVLSLRLPSAAMNVIAFGETSGTDILTGIYFGQKIYPN